MESLDYVNLAKESSEKRHTNKTIVGNPELRREIYFSISRGKGANRNIKREICAGRETVEKTPESISSKTAFFFGRYTTIARTTLSKFQLIF